MLTEGNPAAELIMDCWQCIVEERREKERVRSHAHACIARHTPFIFSTSRRPGRGSPSKDGPAPVRQVAQVCAPAAPEACAAAAPEGAPSGEPVHDQGPGQEPC
eukprot:scaffold153224_cov18-Tisochrysis_lutea.AAC.6